MSERATPLAEHVESLRQRFAASVLRELDGSPGPVLDIGAGWGRVAMILRDAQVEVVTTESHASAVDGLRARGFASQIVRAERLPFADRSFDVVAMRHLLHHLDDPLAALSEALRVAKRAVVFAEPCFADSVPGRAALEFDLWFKRLERRGGRVHAPNLGEPEIREAVAATGCGPEPVFERVGLDALREPSEIDAEVAGVLDQTGTVGDRAWFTRFRESVDRHGIARNGSLIACLRVQPGATA